MQSDDQPYNFGKKNLADKLWGDLRARLSEEKLCLEIQKGENFSHRKPQSTGTA